MSCLLFEGIANLCASDDTEGARGACGSYNHNKEHVRLGVPGTLLRLQLYENRCCARTYQCCERRDGWNFEIGAFGVELLVTTKAIHIELGQLWRKDPLSGDYSVHR